MMWQVHPDSPASGKGEANGEANAGTSTKAAAAAKEQEYQVRKLRHLMNLECFSNSFYDLNRLAIRFMKWII